MPRILTDNEIDNLLNEPKLLPSNWKSRLVAKSKAQVSHLESELGVTGESGNKFTICVRENQLGMHDFSIILFFVDKDKSTYRLTRFNGKHSHTNHYEKRNGLPNASFRNEFHVHKATERYQLGGFPIDGYAEVTATYCTMDGAVREFVNSNGFDVQTNDPGQKKLF